MTDIDDDGTCPHCGSTHTWGGNEGEYLCCDNCLSVVPLGTPTFEGGPTMTKYWVSAFIRDGAGAAMPRQFGPFSSAAEAERCVTALAARSDVTSARLEAEPDEEDQP